MQLAAYLDSHEPKLTAKAFAERIGVDPSMVTRWRLRQTIPDPENMRRIIAGTHGAVTANDFHMPISPAELARELPAEQVPA